LNPLLSYINIFINIMTNENPLKVFFRKSKFKMTLPSGGKWYPAGSIDLNPDGTVNVFAMNADDDIRFRAGEVSLTGKATLDLIKSCIPAIVQPELVPSLDIDSILLAIRAASYGDDFTTTVSVPKTKMVRKLNIKISELLGALPSDPIAWDDKLTITNEDNMKLAITLRPIQLQELFRLTKFILVKQRSLQNLITTGLESIDTEKLDDSIHEITGSAIDMICGSIQNAIITDATEKQLAKYEAGIDDKATARELLSNLDVAYFNAIKNHLDLQKKKYTIMTGMVEATKEEIEAGADKQWQAEVIFGGSEFFGG
jgi:hypothetical protein